MTRHTLRTMTLASGALLATAFGAPAFAQDWSGFYAGVSLGYADARSSTGDVADNANDNMYSIYGGYQADLGTWVIGAELEYAAASDSTDADLAIDSAGRAKLRFGYDAGAILPYATVGWSNLATASDITGDDSGFLYGIGADYLVTDSVLVGAELLRQEIDDFGGSGIDFSSSTVALRVGFKF